MRLCLLFIFIPIIQLLTGQTVSGPCAGNGSCNTASAIVVNESITQVCVNGCNSGLAPGPINSNAGPCTFMANPTAWYVFNSGINNKAKFQLASTQLTNPKFALFSSCDQWIECNPSISDLLPNTDYYIAITDDDGKEGDFDFCLNLYHATDSCLNSHKLEVVGSSMGSPLAGPFLPCEEITFRYTVNFSKTGNNWIHSIIPVISDCFEHIQNTEPINTIVPEGNAPWAWVDADSLYWKPGNNQESLIGINEVSGKLCLLGQPGCSLLHGGTECSKEGSALPCGWVATVNSDNCKSDRPNLSWGDSRTGNHIVTFTLKVPCNACDNLSCNDYSVSVANFGDGQTGGYSSNKCNGSVMASKKVMVKCCQPPILTMDDDEICSKAAFNPLVTLDPSNSTVEWSVIVPEGVYGAKNGSGTIIGQVLQNTTDEDQTVVYQVIPVSPSGCKGDTTTVEVIVHPDIISNIDKELINCKDSVLYMEADPEGGSGDDYSYSWSTGSEKEWIKILTNEEKTLTLTITDGSGCTQKDTFHISTITEGVSLPETNKLYGTPTVFISNFNTFSCDSFPVAQFYEWSIDGTFVGYGRVTNFRIPFTTLGSHTLCVRASNSCDLEGQTLCWDIKIIESPLKMDCTGAEYICNKEEKKLTFPGSYGLVLEMNTGDFCFGNTYGESNSHWLDFDIVMAGKFWFTIKPKKPQDIDFVVFKQVDEKGCYTKKSVRCSYAGGGDCNGDLGLSPDEVDEYEGGGCGDTQNNFLAALDCEVGDHYYIAILAYNNVEMTRYDVEFCGDALLTCDTEICATLGSSNANINKALNIYPNPNDGNFIVEIPAMLVGQIEVFDVNGKVIFRQKINKNDAQNAINLSKFSAGMYNLIVRTNDGNISGNSKIIIQ